MTTIEKCIDYFLNDFTHGRNIREFRESLNYNIPGWQSIVSDPGNWNALDKIKFIKGDSNAFYILIFESAGIELLKRWFHQMDKYQRKDLVKWFCWHLENWEYYDQDIKNEVMKHHMFHDAIIDLSSEGINRFASAIWSDLTDEHKEIFIENLFAEFPGEPYNSMKYYNRRCYEPFYDRFTPLYLMGYITSPEINIFLSAIKRLKDKKFVRLIENKIKERKKACQKNISNHKTPYTTYNLNRDERDLVSLLLNKFLGCGYKSAQFPLIYISTEIPPLFYAYPELEYEEYDCKNLIKSKQKIPYRGKPETISIEELLGVYQPRKKQIILFLRGIRWFSSNYNISEKWLFSVVLIHEIGHWITHMLPKSGIPVWSTDLFELVHDSVHEGWAQLMTFWIAEEETTGNFKKVFNELNNHQTYPYKVFQKFSSEPIYKMIESLENLRALSLPAKLNDWEKLIM